MTDSDGSDEIDAILGRLRIGDNNAKRELVEIAFRRLRKLAARMLSEFPVAHRWEDTDDILQRAATRLWQSLDEITPENHVHLFRLSALQIRRELIDLTRSLQGPLGLANNMDSVIATGEGNACQNGEPGSDSLEPSKLHAWGEFHQKVGDLDCDERQVFELIWYQGLSQESVAELTGTSQKTVSRRWLRARRQLYRLLDGQLPD